MNKLAIIQARMSSSRLPGKVLMDIAGKPMLERLIGRAQRARLIDRVVLATTTDPSDDILAEFCQRIDIPCYRGSMLDVLDRVYHAAIEFQAEIIVRLTADCPLLDPELIDLTISTFLGNINLPISQQEVSSLDRSAQTPVSFDFVANRLPPPWKRTLPIGLDVEVCSLQALQQAWSEAKETYQREHVMPFLYEGVVFPAVDLSPGIEWYLDQGVSPRGFRVALLNHFPDYGSLRWTVDTSVDLEFVRQIFAHFSSQAIFSWQQVLALLEQEPELAAINVNVDHKSAYDVDQRASDS